MPTLASSRMRFEAAAPARLRAAQIGCVAAQALREGASGTVRAVFERSFYLELNRQWICVGPRALGAGPLNLLCEPESLAVAMTRFVAVDACVVCADRRLRLGPSLEISLTDAAAWMPGPPATWHKAALRRGLAAFAAELPDVLPAAGLARLLGAANAALSSVAAAAQAPAGALRDLIRAAGGAGEIEAKPLAPLLGLGPGLTPSGDDFLGGALIALHLLGLTPLRDAIWAALEPLVATSTNEVSAAHLAAAAEGFGGAALHALLNDVIAARTEALPQRIAALAVVGHTSGWDALAGAITVLRARLR